MEKGGEKKEDDRAIGVGGGTTRARGVQQRGKERKSRRARVPREGRPRKEKAGLIRRDQTARAPAARRSNEIQRRPVMA